LVTSTYFVPLLIVNTVILAALADLNVGVLLVPFTASSRRGGAGRVELGAWGWEGGARLGG